MYEQYFNIKEKVKRFNYICISFLSVFSFALCACQSEKQVSGPVCVKDVALKANLSGAVSRTTMTDTYGGAFAQTWNNDVLSIYHTYQNNGTAQSLMPLSFTTTATGTSSAVFVYTDISDYAYNPGQPVYAFNKLTGTGQSTPSVTGAATPLSVSLTGWTSQDGTLTGTQNAALYDAMAGYTTTDASTGVPGSLTMNHLGSVLSFHLTCDDFTDGTVVRNLIFTTQGSDGKNPPAFFPASATVSVASDGTCTTTPSLVSSWSPSGNFTAANKAVDVYLSTFPFSSLASGTKLMIYAEAAGNSYGAVVSIDNLSLASSKVKCITSALTKIVASSVTSTTYSQLYAWDATDYQPVTLNKSSTNANKFNYTGSSDGLNHASYACKNCPNFNEIGWYFKGSCYWDDGTSSANGGNVTNYTLANTLTTTSGVWFLKKCFIDGFSSTTSGNPTCGLTRLSDMNAAQISALHLDKYYFFLPAAGYASSSVSVFSQGGKGGYYWLSTPFPNVTFSAYYLYFYDASAYITSYLDRACGFCLWEGQ